MSRGDWRTIRVIRDDDWNLNMQFTLLATVKQIDQAVILLRHHDQDAALVVHVAQGHRGRQVRGCLVNSSTYCGQVVGRRLEASAITEQVLGRLSELRLLKDVRADREQCARDRMGDAGAVRAPQGEDEVMHGRESRRSFLGSGCR